MTDDPVAQLKAGLDEDEAAAKAATAGPWEWMTPDHAEWDDYGPHLMSKTATWTTPEGRGPYPVMVLGSWGYDAWGVSVEDADAAHIARQDPDRTLRRVAAYRKILARYERLTNPQTLSERLVFPSLAQVTLDTIRDLAAVYSDDDA